MSSKIQSIFDALHIFLAAAIGFSSRKDAESCKWSGYDFDPMETTSRTYFQNAFARDFALGEYLTGFTSNNAPQWYSLHNVEKRPVGSYNVMLAVEGPRKAYTADRAMEELPCYAAWSTADGKPLALANSRAATKIYAARSGRGVIMTRQIERTRNKAHRVTYRILGVEFQTLDSNPAKGDMARITRPFKEQEWVMSFAEPFTPHIHADGFILDNTWTELVSRAYKGLESNFPPVPDEDKRQIEYYFQQLEKYNADQGLFTEATTRADSFREQFRKRGWKLGLQEVTEAWQLATIVKNYIIDDSQRFRLSSSTDNRPRTRFDRMLWDAELSVEKRIELQAMISNFFVLIYSHF